MMRNTTLKTRGITAIIFVAIMLFGIFFHAYSFLALMSVIIAGCVWEFLNITCEKSLFRNLVCMFSAVVISLMLGLNILNDNWFDNPNATNLLFVFTILVLSLYEMSTKSTKPFVNIAFSTFSLAYYAFFLSSIYYICFKAGDYDNSKVFALIALTWTNDTMAYVVGSKIGKTKMFERMSPKKTWEGTMGGIFFTVIAALIIYHFMGIFSLPVWLGLALIIGIFGTLGDLVESMLKRSYTMKDTGTLLPGHGGLLDRFDSLTFHLPLSVYFIQLTSSF